MVSSCGFNLILRPKTKQATVVFWIQMTGGCFISHGGSVLTQVIRCYWPSWLAAARWLPWELQGSEQLALCHPTAAWVRRLLLIKIKKVVLSSSYVVCLSGSAALLCCRLQWDVGQDHLLAQRRRRTGGHHPLPQISLLLLRGRSYS